MAISRSLLAGGVFVVLVSLLLSGANLPWRASAPAPHTQSPSSLIKEDATFTSPKPTEEAPSAEPIQAGTASADAVANDAEIEALEATEEFSLRPTEEELVETVADPAGASSLESVDSAQAAAEDTSSSNTSGSSDDLATSDVHTITVTVYPNGASAGGVTTTLSEFHTSAFAPVHRGVRFGSITCSRLRDRTYFVTNRAPESYRGTLDPSLPSHQWGMMLRRHSLLDPTDDNVPPLNDTLFNMAAVAMAEAVAAEAEHPVQQATLEAGVVPDSPKVRAANEAQAALLITLAEQAASKSMNSIHRYLLRLAEGLVPAPAPSGGREGSLLGMISPDTVNAEPDPALSQSSPEVDFTLCEDVRDLPSPLGGRLATLVRHARLAAAELEKEGVAAGKAVAEDDTTSSWDHASMEEEGIELLVATSTMLRNSSRGSLVRHTVAIPTNFDIETEAETETTPGSSSSSASSAVRPVEWYLPCGLTRSVPVEPWQWCHVYSGAGDVVTSWADLLEAARREELRVAAVVANMRSKGDEAGAAAYEKAAKLLGVRLYLVAPDRLFVYPYVELGHVIRLPSSRVERPVPATVASTLPQTDPTDAEAAAATASSASSASATGSSSAGSGKLPVEVVSVNESPRVFYLRNFISAQEAQKLIADATTRLAESHVYDSEAKAFKAQSTTRSSETSFDMSLFAEGINMRAFATLALPSYVETLADGIQILRYNTTRAYVEHHDYFSRNVDPHYKFDPAQHESSANRFATILLYLKPAMQGGETVFPLSEPNMLAPPLTAEQKAAYVKRAEEAGMEKGTWQHDMVVRCSERLAVRPFSVEAAFFYNQRPNGTLDTASLHGGCPVLSTDAKWAANLWVWNGPRYLMPNAGETRDPRTGTSNPPSLYAPGSSLDAEQLEQNYGRRRRRANARRLSDLLGEGMLTGDGRQLDIVSEEDLIARVSYDEGNWWEIGAEYLEVAAARGRGHPATPFDRYGDVVADSSRAPGGLAEGLTGDPELDVLTLAETALHDLMERVEMEQKDLLKGTVAPTTTTATTPASSPPAAAAT